MKFSQINIDKYKVIAFDIDGTLYPIRQMYKVIVKAFFRHPRLSRALRYFRIEDRLVHHKENNYHEREALYFKKYFNLKTLKEGQDLAKKIYLLQASYFEKDIKPFKGVRETFKKIKEQDKKIVLLSDFQINNKPKALKVDSFVDASFFSAQSGELKPSKKAFSLISNYANCRMDEILYIGDRVEKDYLGAINAGCDAYLYTKKKSKYKSFSSYEE